MFFLYVYLYYHINFRLSLILKPRLSAYLLRRDLSQKLRTSRNGISLDIGTFIGLVMYALEMSWTANTSNNNLWLLELTLPKRICLASRLVCLIVLFLYVMGFHLNSILLTSFCSWLYFINRIISHETRNFFAIAHPRLLSSCFS